MTCETGTQAQASGFRDLVLFYVVSGSACAGSPPPAPHGPSITRRLGRRVSSCILPAPSRQRPPASSAGILKKAASTSGPA